MKNLKKSASLKRKTFLDIIAYRYSDNQFAKIMRIKEKQLFDKIGKMKG